MKFVYPNSSLSNTYVISQVPLELMDREMTATGLYRVQEMKVTGAPT